MRPQEIKFIRNLTDRFCAPKPVIAASEWAEKNLVFNEPKIKGPFTLSGRQYLREMVDAAGVLFVKSKSPDANTIQLASETGIPLVVTRLGMFEACGKLFAAAPRR